MSELVPVLGVVARVLAIWTLVSVAAAVPIISWLRYRAAANALVARDARRQAWLAAVR